MITVSCVLRCRLQVCGLPGKRCCHREDVAILGAMALEGLFGWFHSIRSAGRTRSDRINFGVIGMVPEKGFSGSLDECDVVTMPVTDSYRTLSRDCFSDICVMSRREKQA